jgi:Rps23 Pro-64 3,4-dihydroxylase Tpa1-like proline 4-hydroxylase
MQLIHADAGACFPYHFDSEPNVPGQQISAVLYLNEHWKDGDGGEIELVPFPFAPVRVSPRFGRLVVFSSSQMLHRVLPCHRSRFSLTFWL